MATHVDRATHTYTRVRAYARAHTTLTTFITYRLFLVCRTKPHDVTVGDHELELHRVEAVPCQA